MSAIGTITTLMDRVLGAVFRGDSWATWRSLLRAAYGLVLSATDLATFTRFTGRQTAPDAPCRETWWIVGRRAGKSVIAALTAVYATCCCSYVLAPGELGVFMVIAADRRQARVIKRYISGLLHSCPELEVLVAPKGETRDAIRLTNGLTIEIHTASYRTLRGYTVIGAACDEVAFWRDDESANPDREILTALRAAMVTVPNAMLVCISSPYARRGELWRIYQKYFGKEDAPVLVVQGATQEFNPTAPADLIEAAYDDDPAAAGAEYGAEFRRDVETYVSREALDAAVVEGRRELPPVQGVHYAAFCDPAGGSGKDSMTLAIAHRLDSGIVQLDALREARPPFSPESVTAEFCELLKTYGVMRVTSDRYAGDWPKEQFRKLGGISVDVAEKPKSDLYRDFLPMLMSGQVELLDDPRLLAQMGALERRTGRGGRDVIDHPPGSHSHDDRANCVAGVSVGVGVLNRGRGVREIELVGM